MSDDDGVRPLLRTDSAAGYRFDCPIPGCGTNIRMWSNWTPAQQLRQMVVEEAKKHSCPPAPEHWPPRMGDVWEDAGGRFWVAYDDGKSVSMLMISAPGDDPGDVSTSTFGATGPIKLRTRLEA